MKLRFSALALAWVLTTSLHPSLMQAARAAEPHQIRVIELTEYLTAFYTGRVAPAKDASKRTWAEYGALDLGVATYAIHRGSQAIVYDTFTSPDLAQWVRDYLERSGVTRFTVVDSHWHLDHVGGNAVYQDSNIISTRRTREALVEKKSLIEAGKLWGPPPVKPLILPNIVFDDRLDLLVGDIRIELHNVHIHTVDSVVAYIPAYKALLAGDTVEDSVTFVSEPETAVQQIKNLAALRQWEFERILPNHGDPEVMAKGGYDKTLIDATAGYVRKLLVRAHDKGFLESSLEDFIGDSVAKGWVSLWRPYNHVHEINLKRIHRLYKDKPLATIPE